tara:strand:- start:367 stop:861 length:495 start_codon:yes stop_codon:yes gene_type:complete
MKKIASLSIAFILLVYLSACAGYKPIFSSSNLQFKINDYFIQGNKKLGNQIYSKLYILSKSNDGDLNAQNINITINLIKNKSATAKNTAGKIIEYKISLDTNILLIDSLSKNEILNYQSTNSSSYKVQDQHSETLKLENRAIENLITETYANFLIQMSENITTQ